MNIFHSNSDNKINGENIRKDWVGFGFWLLTAENCMLNSSGGLRVGSSCCFSLSSSDLFWGEEEASRVLTPGDFSKTSAPRKAMIE